MKDVVMKRRSFLLESAALVGGGWLARTVVRKAALFLGADPALDAKKAVYLREKIRSETLEGVITGRDGSPFTRAKQEGQPADVVHNAYASIVGMRSKVYGSTGLRRLCADQLFYAERPHGRGSTLQTTLQPNWQIEAYKLLDGFRASIVLMDTDTGEVYVLAERASPNIEFDVGSLSDKMELYNKEPDFWYSPSASCCLQPGSTQKIIDAAAIFASGMEEEYVDTGVSATGIHNAGRAAYGKVDVEQGLVDSINTLFADMIPLCGPELYKTTVESFFYNNTVELDWGVELAPKLVFDQKDAAGWSQLAIGQGRIETAPLHLSCVIGAVLDPEGAMKKPCMIQSITTESGNITYQNGGGEVLLVPLADDTVREKLAAALEAAAAGYGLSFPGARVLAKTGTATIQGSEKNNVFLSFAVEMANGKRYAGCLSREKVSGTSSQLKPIAKEIIQMILKEG